MSIAAPPERVWPWVVRIGRGRGGYYTYTWVENLLGADIHNLDHLDPALQDVAPGDRIWLTPERYVKGRIPGQYWRVHEVDPGRALVLVQEPPANPNRGAWTLVVQPDGRHGSRLVSRTNAEPPESVAERLLGRFWAAGNSVMVRGMLLGIKRRCEASVDQGSPLERPDGGVTVANNAFIRQDPEPVFACLTDLNREREWNEQLRAVEALTDGPLRAGSRYRVRFGRGVGDSVITYEQLERPRRWRTRSTSRMLDVRFTGSVTPMAGGSQVDLHTTLLPRGPLRLVRPLLARTMRKSWDQHLATITATLERPAEP